MRALVVHCHPVAGSFSSALRDAAVRGLERAGHAVDVLDLAADGFDPVMGNSEWDAYMSHDGADITVPAGLEHHVAVVQSADILVFVYPTWWSGLPAQLKGWLERVMVPGVAFRLDDGRVRPALVQVRRIVTVSTYGSPWTYVKAINDNGRRTLQRALRLSTGWRTTRRHLGLYKMDVRTDLDRARFLRRVEKALSR
ncbi:MAG: NAD(P)H-dependent oxidoreductase [Ilumatobacteraceae bacterium]